MASKKMMEAMKIDVDPDRKKAWEWLVGSDEKLKNELSLMMPWKREIRQETVDYVRTATEIMLENTREEIANSLNDARLKDLTPEKFYEETDTVNIVPFTRFALPIIRRVVPRIYAKSLVGFQPMPMPTGKVFYLDFTYGTAKYPTVAGDRVDLVAKMNRAYGGARQYMTFTGVTGATQSFTLFDYGAVGVQVFDNGVAVTSGVVVSAGGGGGASHTAADPDLVTVTPGITTGHTVTIIYDNQAEGQVANDIDMSMESDTITAEAIKLRSAMTVETMQDFAAYHGISSETELTNALAAEVDREIDLSILTRLFYFATAGNTNWDSNGYLVGDDNTFFRREYRKTLYEAIVATNNLIYRKRFVNATWIVGGVGAIERLEKLERFVINESMGAPDDGQLARRYVGTLDGKWAVYKDARLADNVILFGYTGDTPFHTGAVFAPYIPAYMTDLLPDPSINFKVRKGIMSRFGFKVVISDCYATLTIL